MKHDRGKKQPQPRLGSKAKDLFDKAEQAVEIGSKAVDGLRALDTLFAGGLKLVPGIERVQTLERENQAMRVALCSLLAEAGGNVQFKSVQPFPFDVVTHRGHVVVRRVR